MREAMDGTKGPPDSAVSVSVVPVMEPVAVTYVESDTTVLAVPDLQVVQTRLAVVVAGAE